MMTCLTWIAKSLLGIYSFFQEGLEQDITMPAMGNQNPLIGGLYGLCCNCTSCPFLYAMEVTSVTSSKSLIKTFYLDSFCHTVNDISASFQLTLKLSKITFQSFCCSAMSLGKCIALTFVTCDALTTRLWGLQKPLFKSNFLESFGFWPCQRPSLGIQQGAEERFSPNFRCDWHW